MSRASDVTLETIPLFEGLPSAARTALGHLCTWVRYAPGDVVIDVADDSGAVGFLVEGRLRVGAENISGDEIGIGTIETGAYFGEISAIDDGPRTGMVLADTEALVAHMPKQVFLQVMADHPAIALMVMRRLAWFTRRATNELLLYSIV